MLLLSGRGVEYTRKEDEGRAAVLAMGGRLMMMIGDETSAWVCWWVVWGDRVTVRLAGGFLIGAGSTCVQSIRDVLFDAQAVGFIT